MKIRWMRGRWREELPGTHARWLLTPGWLVFRPVVAMRNYAFNCGWRTIHKLPVPVWSVGNITAGGTGKTPLTQYLATWATTKGLHPAIISRGYGAKAGQENDEAQMVNECPVYCNPDRVAGGQQALSAGANCLILDDAFQHRRIHRDLNIVTIDATKPWGSSNLEAGMTLPLGYLRESRTALARADILAITRSSLLSETERSCLQKQLATFGKPLIHVVDEGAALLTFSDTTVPLPTDHLQNKPVILVSGIGNPHGFERAAQYYGWDVVESLRFPDHYHYELSDIKDILATAQLHQASIVITGKDAVKMRAIVQPNQCEAIYILNGKSAIAQSDQSLLDELLNKTLHKT